MNILKFSEKKDVYERRTIAASIIKKAFDSKKYSLEDY